MNYSKSHPVIKWKPIQPIVPLYRYLNISTAEKTSENTLDLDISLDSKHANLPKETLGSHLITKIPRPQSAVFRSRPSFKVNTLNLSKEFHNQSSGNKQERINLVQKLKRMCNTRSAQLFEDVAKEVDIEKDQIISNELANQVKQLWDEAYLVKRELPVEEKEQNKVIEAETKKDRPQSAVKKTIISKFNHIIVPGLNRPSSAAVLSVIHEGKHSSSNGFPIVDSEIQYYKKPCNLQLFHLQLKDKRRNSGFKGNVVRKVKRKKISRAMTTETNKSVSSGTH